MQQINRSFIINFGESAHKIIVAKKMSQVNAQVSLDFGDRNNMHFHCIAVYRER